MLDDATKELLTRFRESIILPLANTDADKWPIRSGRISRLCLDEFSYEFFEDIEVLRERQESAMSIAALFHNPSRLWRMSHHLLNGLRLRAEPLEVQQQAILTLLELVSYLKFGDPFCADGANILWKPEQAKKVVQEAKFREGLDAARLVHQLAGILWAYTESLYFVAHELSVEIHGPYTLPDGTLLLVRDFFDLQPSDLWSSTPFLSPQIVRIMTIYRHFPAHLDAYNNLYVAPGTRLIDEMLSCEVLIDNHRADLSQVKQLLLEASEAITAITNEVHAWSLEQIVRHYIRIFWWRKAPLRKELRKDWQPPEKVLKRVTARNIPDPTFVNPSLEALRNQYNLL